LLVVPVLVLLLVVKLTILVHVRIEGHHHHAAYVSVLVVLSLVHLHAVLLHFFLLTGLLVFLVSTHFHVDDSEKLDDHHDAEHDQSLYILAEDKLLDLIGKARQGLVSASIGTLFFGEIGEETLCFVTDDDGNDQENGVDELEGQVNALSPLETLSTTEALFLTALGHSIFVKKLPGCNQGKCETDHEGDNGSDDEKSCLGGSHGIDLGTEKLKRRIYGGNLLIFFDIIDHISALGLESDVWLGEQLDLLGSNGS
jgi:hypothetical protein